MTLLRRSTLPAGASAAGPAVASPVPPAPLVAADFNEAVARAGNRLVADAQSEAGDAPRSKPRARYRWASNWQPSSRHGHRAGTFDRCREKPSPTARCLLLGTLTAINTPKVAADAPADAFRICLTLTDIRTGRIVAKQVDRATAATVNAEPTPFFRDSPTWQKKDKTVNAYIKSCQGSKRGDSIDPA